MAAMWRKINTHTRTRAHTRRKLLRTWHENWKSGKIRRRGEICFRLPKNEWGSAAEWVQRGWGGRTWKCRATMATVSSCPTLNKK